MKILLLHEMSGVHTELKKGLERIGVTAEIATFGDGFKDYKSDIYLGPKGSGILPSLGRGLTQIYTSKKFHDYDVIQSISPDPFFRPLSKLLNSYVFSGGAKVFYLAAGSDAIYRNHIRELSYYPPHDWYENRVKYECLRSMLRKFSGIIPVCWEYEYTLKRAGLLTSQVIPFPIDVRNQRHHEIGSGKKLTFFHPLNRPNPKNDFKGTKIIRQVFDKLQEKHGKYANFICKGSMDHVEYNQFVDGVDVIVDQLYSQTYGMSAAYGLAKGKIVLSGLENCAVRKGHYAECPILNVVPNADDLIEKIENIIMTDRKEIRSLGMKSRAFAEKYHDNALVAQEYMRIWTQ